MSDTPSENAALISFIQGLRTQTVAKDLASAPAADQVIIFSDKTTLSLEKFANNPRRKRASVSLHDQASFADYINQHKIPLVTALFGVITTSGGSFSGIIDYHTQNIPPSPDATPGAPTLATPGNPANWGEHRVGFTLAFTPEWQRWTKLDGQPIAQRDFAEFIEDNLPDIVKPTAADLLEVVQDLIAKKSVDFRSSERLNNGQTKLVYDETIQTQKLQTQKRDGAIEVPNEFTVAIAPFVGCAPVALTARLRFRIDDDGRLYFIYRLNQPQKVIENAFDSARSYIATNTELPVLLGTASVSGIPS